MAPTSHLRFILLFICFLFHSACVTSSSEEPPTCNGEVLSPLPKRMVGQLYYRLDDCYRPRADSILKVFKKSFRFEPFLGDPFISCRPYYFFVYRQYPKHPFIMSAPAVNYLDQGEKLCSQAQLPNRTVLTPAGKTKDQFRIVLIEMIAELERISAFECGKSGTFIIIKPGRNFKQVDVQLVISYLRSVAYQYSICL